VPAVPRAQAHRGGARVPRRVRAGGRAPVRCAHCTAHGNTRAHARSPTHARTHARTRTPGWMPLRAHPSTQHHTLTSTYPPSCTPLRTYTFVFTCIYVYMYIYTWVYRHIYIYACVPPPAHPPAQATSARARTHGADGPLGAGGHCRVGYLPRCGAPIAARDRTCAQVPSVRRVRQDREKAVFALRRRTRGPGAPTRISGAAPKRQCA
jgi:hypothetical protein